MPTVDMWNDIKHRLLTRGFWLFDKNTKQFGFNITAFFDPLCPRV